MASETQKYRHFEAIDNLGSDRTMNQASNSMGRLGV